MIVTTYNYTVCIVCASVNNNAIVMYEFWSACNVSSNVLYTDTIECVNFPLWHGFPFNTNFIVRIYPNQLIPLGNTTFNKITKRISYNSISYDIG